MIHSGCVSEEVQVRFRELLALSDAELYAHWLRNVAVNYWHGRYVVDSSERSKKLLFGRWKRFLQRYVEAPVGAEEPGF